MSKLRLVASRKKSKAEEMLEPGSDEFEFNEAEVLRLVGGSAANGDKNDPIVFQGAAELQIRKMIAKYGFDRVPMTYGEFQGMQDYCARLDIALGDGIVKEEMRGDWSTGGVQVWEETMPKYKPAAKLYTSGDIDGLRKFHLENNVMKALGKEFDEFAED